MFGLLMPSRFQVAHRLSWVADVLRALRVGSFMRLPRRKGLAKAVRRDSGYGRCRTFAKAADEYPFMSQSGDTIDPLLHCG